MKVRFFILSILIVVLLGATAYYGFCLNRYLSYMELTLNTTYGSRYNPPAFTDSSKSGTDTDFPLFAMTHTSVGYTDDVVTEWYDWVTTKTPIPFPRVYTRTRCLRK